MNYCIKCGAELSEHAKFCSECGAKLEQQESVSTPALTTVSGGKNAEKPFYYKWWFWTIVAISLLALIVSSFTLTKNEKMFVEAYKEYVEPTLENPESIEITSIREYTDENGGVVVYFRYKYTTDLGYSKQGSLYVVTNKITIDASLIDLSSSLLLSTSSDEKAIEKYNGKSVKTGFVTENISTLGITDEAIIILSYWQRLQATYKWDAYNLDRINNAIK